MGENLVRLVVADRHSKSGFREGFFRTAYRLERENLMESEDHIQLSKILDWFNDNLEVPRRFNRSRSKGAHYRNARGISWFKDSAVEQISKAQQIAALLRKYGYEVFEVRTDRPGFVVFSDDHQIIAEPFSDIVGVR
jgi:hypothetical protein